MFDTPKLPQNYDMCDENAAEKILKWLVRNSSGCSIGIAWYLDLGNFCEISFLKHSSSIPQGLKEWLRNGWGKFAQFHSLLMIPQSLRNPFAFLKESAESSAKWLAFLEDSSRFLNSADSLRKHGGVISTACTWPSLGRGPARASLLQARFVILVCLRPGGAFRPSPSLHIAM